MLLLFGRGGGHPGGALRQVLREQWCNAILAVHHNSNHSVQVCVNKMLSIMRGSEL